MADRTPADVIDNPERHRFELPLDGGDVAAAYYKPDGEGHFDSDAYGCAAGT